MLNNGRSDQDEITRCVMGCFSCFDDLEGMEKSDGSHDPSAGTVAQ